MSSKDQIILKFSGSKSLPIVVSFCGFIYSYQSTSMNVIAAYIHRGCFARLIKTHDQFKPSIKWHWNSLSVHHPIKISFKKTHD